MIKHAVCKLRDAHQQAQSPGKPHEEVVMRMNKIIPTLDYGPRQKKKPHRCSSKRPVANPAEQFALVLLQIIKSLWLSERGSLDTLYGVRENYTYAWITVNLPT